MQRYVYRLTCGSGFESLHTDYDKYTLVTVIEWEIPFMAKLKQVSERNILCPHCNQSVSIPIITDGSMDAYIRNNQLSFNHSVKVLEKSEPLESYLYKRTLEEINRKAEQETGNRKYLLVHLNEPHSDKVVNCSEALPMETLPWDKSSRRYYQADVTCKSSYSSLKPEINNAFVVDVFDTDRTLNSDADKYRVSCLFCGQNVNIPFKRVVPDMKVIGGTDSSDHQHDISINEVRNNMSVHEIYATNTMRGYPVLDNEGMRVVLNISAQGDRSVIGSPVKPTDRYSRIELMFKIIIGVLLIKAVLGFIQFILILKGL